MNAVTAYQLTSMMEGVVERGTASRAIDLPVPIAGKTGTTNDVKDVWFVGYSSNIVAGCYIGYDTPRTMPGASGGGMCAPVFQEFMAPAIERFGGGPFAVPEGCSFLNIDRFSGARLPETRRRERRVRVLPRRRGADLRRDLRRRLRDGGGPAAGRGGARRLAQRDHLHRADGHRVGRQRERRDDRPRAGSTRACPLLAPCPRPGAGYDPRDHRPRTAMRTETQNIVDSIRPRRLVSRRMDRETARHRLEEFNARVEDPTLWNDPAARRSSCATGRCCSISCRVSRPWSASWATTSS
jgi:membrane peptidoglycan carboxypeptidase